MNNGVDRSGSSSGAAARAWARDALGAVALAEGAIAQRILTDHAELPVPRGGAMNALGAELSVETLRDPRALIARADELASAGERVAIVASARTLASARDGLRAIASKRVGVVAHAVGDLDAGGYADAFALGDIGWGVLFASTGAESLDLALVARRAAEDSGCPFVVVHERTAERHVEPVAPPSRDLCEAFIGAPSARIRRITDAAHPVHAVVGARAFAERVPFALGSALRELGALTGRHHDVFERAPATDTAIVLVGLGSIGDSLIAEVDRLRAGGHDVGAVKIVALRPFAGARIIKALSRALVVSILERSDTPLAQSNPLALEIKAAFADALTWAPDYPGIGRIPRVVSGVVGADGHQLDAIELDAVVQNALADERGRRVFVLGSGDLAHAPHRDAPAASFSARGRVTDADTATVCADLCTAVLASALGLHASASVRRMPVAEGGGFAVDVAAGRSRPRGGHAPHSVRVVVLDDAATLIASNPLARLARGGLVAIPTIQRSADGVWAELPAWAKAIVFDRTAHVVAYEPAAPTTSQVHATWRRAAAFTGLVLAGASRMARGDRTERGIDPSLVAREVADAVRFALGDAAHGDGETIATDAAELARRAFESHIEVPRATVERDEEAIRLGRRDARASRVDDVALPTGLPSARGR